MKRTIGRGNVRLACPAAGHASYSADGTAATSTSCSITRNNASRQASRRRARLSRTDVGPTHAPSPQLTPQPLLRQAVAVHHPQHDLPVLRLD